MAAPTINRCDEGCQLYLGFASELILEGVFSWCDVGKLEVMWFHNTFSGMNQTTIATASSSQVRWLCLGIFSWEGEWGSIRFYGCWCWLAGSFVVCCCSTNIGNSNERMAHSTNNRVKAVFLSELTLALHRGDESCEAVTMSIIHQPEC